MAILYEGWEGWGLYGLETTPGTPVVPALDFGILKNLNSSDSNDLEEEGSIGSPFPAALDENVQQTGGSAEFLPITKDVLLLAKRTTPGLLPSFSIGSGAGPGVNQVGCKMNQLRISLDAGRRLSASLEWFSLGQVDQAAMAAIVPTGEDMNWIKCVTNLSSEVSQLEMTINHNLMRRPVIANATTVYPVAGMKRCPYVIKEGRQRVRLTARFFGRPTETVIEDIATALPTFELECTGLVGATPTTFTITLSVGKPLSKEFTAGEASEAGWPMTYAYTRWDVT